MAEKSDVKFAHGLKANVEAAITAGKIDKDDFVIYSDTDDELGFVTHEGVAKPIKSRTNQAYTLNGTSIGALSDGDTIPAGTSIDDLLALIVAKAIHPTYTAPTVALTRSTGNDVYEVGSLVSTTLTATFNQKDAGELKSISILNDNSAEIITGTTSPLTDAISFQMTSDSGVSYSAKASYHEGDIKKNNLGQDDATGAIPEGTVTAGALKFLGGYKYFAGSTTKTASETAITDLDQMGIAPVNTKNGVTGISSQTITFTVPIGGKTIAFAWPSTVDSSNTQVTYVNLNDNAMFDSFEKSTVSYTLPSGLAMNYDMFVMELGDPTEAEMTFKVNVKGA